MTSPSACLNTRQWYKVLVQSGYWAVSPTNHVLNYASKRNNLEWGR